MTGFCGAAATIKSLLMKKEITDSILEYKVLLDRIHLVKGPELERMKEIEIKVMVYLAMNYRELQV